MALHTPLVGLPPKKFRRKFGRNAARDKFEESPQEVREIVLASLGNHEFFLKKVRFLRQKLYMDLQANIIDMAGYLIY